MIVAYAVVERGVAVALVVVGLQQQQTKLRDIMESCV